MENNAKLTNIDTDPNNEMVEYGKAVNPMVGWIADNGSNVLYFTKENSARKFGAYNLTTIPKGSNVFTD